MDSNASHSEQNLNDSQQRVTVAYTNQPCRRKLQFINGKFAVQKPQTSTVQKRNERERNRVKLINRSFATLRDHLPKRYNGKKAKKLSKVEVLKTASTYIAYLARLLESDCPADVGEFSFDQLNEQSEPQSQAQTQVDNQEPSSAGIGQPAELSSGLCDLSDLLMSDEDDNIVSAVGSDFTSSALFHLSSEAVDISSVSCSPTDQPVYQQQQQQQQQLIQLLGTSNSDCFNMSTPIKQTQCQQGPSMYYLLTAAPSASACTSATTAASAAFAPEIVNIAGQFNCSATSDVQILSVSDPSGTSGYLQYL